MIKVTLYILAVGALFLAGLTALLLETLPALTPFRIPLLCALSGGLGGCLYCLRAIYLNRAVRNQWNREWEIWYFLRPIASAGCGAVSYIFLKAGLLVLESSTDPNASELGFYALAFVAGMNVDKFIKKIEDVSEAVWGIERSRAQENNKREE